jgi:hypothetical protein
MSNGPAMSISSPMPLSPPRNCGVSPSLGYHSILARRHTSQLTVAPAARSVVRPPPVPLSERRATFSRYPSGGFDDGQSFGAQAAIRRCGVWPLTHTYAKKLGERRVRPRGSGAALDEAASRPCSLAAAPTARVPAVRVERFDWREAFGCAGAGREAVELALELSGWAVEPGEVFLRFLGRAMGEGGGSYSGIAERSRSIASPRGERSAGEDEVFVWSRAA